MAGRPGRKTLMAAALTVVMALCAFSLQPLGCGEPSREDMLAEVSEAATAFLNACGNMDVTDFRSYFTAQYLQDNKVPDPVTQDDLADALGYLESYRIVPAEDISAEEDRAVIAVNLELRGKEESEETLTMRRGDGVWKVSGFTAMDWMGEPPPDEDESTPVEQALRDFLIACVDDDTRYIFDNLSEEYRETYRLEEPWTATEFSGVFGTARSFDFNPGEIEMTDGAAEVDVTVEFGSRGNLQSETSRVRLVKEGEDWLIDAFPFFIY